MSSKSKTVMALLIVLALPTVSTKLLTRDTAQHLADCQNNLKTIGTAIDF